jgi:hypothetical protein
MSAQRRKKRTRDTFAIVVDRGSLFNSLAECPVRTLRFQAVDCRIRSDTHKLRILRQFQFVICSLCVLNNNKIYENKSAYDRRNYVWISKETLLLIERTNDTSASH